MTATEKYWSDSTTFFIQTYILLRVCHVTDPVLKGTNIKCKKLSVNCYICYLLLSISKDFASMSCFYAWNFPTIFGNWFLFHKIITIYIYILYVYICQLFAYLVYIKILNGSIPLKRLYIYITLMVCNKILFSILNILISFRTLSYRRKRTHPLLIGVFHQMISMQDLAIIMSQLNLP